MRRGAFAGEQGFGAAEGLAYNLPRIVHNKLIERRHAKAGHGVATLVAAGEQIKSCPIEPGIVDNAAGRDPLQARIPETGRNHDRVNIVGGGLRGADGGSQQRGGSAKNGRHADFLSLVC